MEKTTLEITTKLSRGALQSTKTKRNVRTRRRGYKDQWSEEEIRRGYSRKPF